MASRTKKRRKTKSPRAAASLEAYREKRDFEVTSEPEEDGTREPGALQFVVQKH